MIACTKHNDKECLPDIIVCSDLANWNAYLDDLYETIFKPDFIHSCPTFMGWKVFIRKEPKDGEREHGFTHMTHVDHFHKSSDPNDRIPDLRRSERLIWVKKIIENYECIQLEDCNEILYWEEFYRGYIRCFLLFEKERFLVVLEKRRNVYFIITSFYLEKDWELRKRLEKHKQYIQQKTPLV